ncbi:MAG: MBL fold metallo-hydrolase RNA specificity domain-containing protein [Luteolibacter sp.]
MTATLLRERFRLADNRIEAVPFQVPITRDGFRLRLLPAGHISGSAMLHVTRIKDNASLLYTGDFKTRRGRTAEPVNFLTADTLILETTFGLPCYEFPSQMEVEAHVLRFVQDAFADSETPVLIGYSLGKAQEALALLTEHGIPTLLHTAVAAMTLACRAAGVQGLPEPLVFEGHALPGHVIIAPPNALRSNLFRGLKAKRTAMLTGWAMQPGAKYRYRVDEVIPFSDHADHPGLMECIQRVRPKKTLTVHGFTKEFAAELRMKGMDAWCAMGGDQMELPINQASQRLGSSSPRHSRAICALADFSDLCRLVGETSSRIAKADFITTYLRGLTSDRDLRLAVLWLGGEALPRENGKAPLSVDATTLRHTLTSLPGMRPERFKEISRHHKDAARTARMVLQEIPLKPDALDLTDLEAFFLELAATSGSLERINRLAARLGKLHPVEGETLVKLLTGDLRINLTTATLEEAIAGAFQADPREIQAAHRLTGHLGETAVLARNKRLGEAKPNENLRVDPAGKAKSSDQLSFQPPI